VHILDDPNQRGLICVFKKQEKKIKSVYNTRYFVCQVELWPSLARMGARKSLVCNKQDGFIVCMIISSNLRSSLYCSDFLTAEVACGCLHLVVVFFFPKELIHAFILF